MVQRARSAVPVSLDQFTIRVEVDEILRHLLDIFFDPGRGFGPAGAAQAIKSGYMSVGAAVSLDLAQAVERNVERIGPGEFQDEEVALEFLHGQPFEAEIAADAMLYVDDIIADIQILE